MANRPWLAIATASLLLVGLCSGCSDDAPAGGRGPVQPSTASSPFEVVDPPDGFELTNVARGTTEPTWYADHRPSVEPYTLLSVDGTVDGDVVALSYLYSADNPTALRPGESVNERFAWGEVAVGEDWSDLVVSNDGFALVRVSSSPPSDEGDLRRIGAAAPVADMAEEFDVPPAPIVDEPIAGLTVAGRVEAAALSALEPPGPIQGPNDPVGSHAQVWRSADGDVAVRTLPGTAADLDALGAHPWMWPQLVRETAVDGRPARFLRSCVDDWYGRGHDAVCARSLVTVTVTGDLLVVTTDSDDDVDEAALAAFASAVRPSTKATWDELADTVFGLDPLRPDPGREEIDRGRFGGPGTIEWLLQTADGDASPAGTGVDGCVKLGTGERTCAVFGSGGFADPTVDGMWYVGDAPWVPDTGDDPGVGMLAVVVVDGPAALDAASVQVRSPEFHGRYGSVRDAVDLEVELRTVPGHEVKVALVPVAIGVVECAFVDDPPNSALGPVSCVTLLDGDGGELATLGP